MAAMPIETKTREALGCELAVEMLRSSGKVRLRVTGASMLPAIWPGDVLSVRRLDSEPAMPGDVVLCQREGRLVAHRVVQRTFRPDGIQWVLRGDSVAGNDPAFSGDELLGQVVAVERGSRQLSPRRPVYGQFASWILCRSDLFTRAVLWFRGQRPRTGTGEKAHQERVKELTRMRNRSKVDCVE